MAYQPVKENLLHALEELKYLEKRFIRVGVPSDANDYKAIYDAKGDIEEIIGQLDEVLKLLEKR